MKLTRILPETDPLHHAIVEHWLHLLEDNPTNHQTAILEIKQAASRAFMVSVEHIESKLRPRYVGWARTVCITTIRRALGLSTPDVAAIFGMHYSNVVSSPRRVEHAAMRYPEFRRCLARFRQYADAAGLKTQDEWYHDTDRFALRG